MSDSIKATLPIPGLGFLAAGIHLLLSDRSLRKYIWIPILITVILFIPVAWFSVDIFQILANHLVPDSIVNLGGSVDPTAGAISKFFLEIWNWIASFFGGLLVILIKTLIFLSLLASVSLLYIVLLKIIASPFNDRLAEKVEHLCDGDNSSSTKNPPILSSIFIALKTESQRMAIFLAVAIPLNLFAPFLPGLGHVITGAILLVYSFLWFTYDAMSYSMDRKLWPLKKRLQFLLSHPWHTLGFGAGVYALAIIPLINLFILPIFVSGGVIFFKKYDVS